MSKIHVFDLLEQPPPDQPPIAVLFGGEPLLRQLARQHLLTNWSGGEQAAVTRYDSEAVWRDVHDELATRSLFSAGPRLVWVDDADSFVSRWRGELEAYAAAPLRSGTLLLDIATFPANTRLYKAVAQTGLPVDCRPPEIVRGRGKPAVDTGRIAKWLCQRAERVHRFKLQVAAAQTLLDLVGVEFGLLEQELAKLALYVPRGKSATPELVRTHAGGWRKQSTWELIDAAVEGKSAEALRQLDQLVRAGESPIGLFAQIAWGLRRFGAAMRNYEQARLRGESSGLRDALAAAGFQPFLLARAEQQMKQIGRIRAQRLLSWILEADLAMKLTHSSPARQRFVLEQLLLRLTNA